MIDLNDLAARCEEGSGGDRELDEAIMAVIYTPDRRFLGARTYDTGEPVFDSVWVDPKTDKWVCTAAFEFTASLDRAVSFVERALPGWRWSVRNDGEDGGPNADVWRSDGEWSVEVYAASPARAIVACALRALAAKEQSNV